MYWFLSFPLKFSYRFCSFIVYFCAHVLLLWCSLLYCDTFVNIFFFSNETFDTVQFEVLTDGYCWVFISQIWAVSLKETTLVRACKWRPALLWNIITTTHCIQWHAWTSGRNKGLKTFAQVIWCQNKVGKRYCQEQSCKKTEGIKWDILPIITRAVRQYNGHHEGHTDSADTHCDPLLVFIACARRKQTKENVHIYCL